jgi:threonine/homoserine/homoserine lactone efflux protein
MRILLSARKNCLILSLSKDEALLGPDMEHLPGFLLAGFALIGSPGPATLSLAAAGAAFGARNGLAYMIGLLVGIVGVMVITATGVVGMLLALPGAVPVVTILAAAYFVYLAIRIATAPPLAETANPRRRPSFLAGLLLNLVNPKGYAAMAALFSGFMLLPGGLALDAATKTLLLVPIVAAVNLAWLFTGATLSRCFRQPRANRVINVTFAVLLIASVAFLLPF